MISRKAQVKGNTDTDNNIVFIRGKGEGERQRRVKGGIDGNEW